MSSRKRRRVAPRSAYVGNKKHAAAEHEASTLGVDLCVDALARGEYGPSCPHGPTLLFEQFYADQPPRKFYACSACRGQLTGSDVLVPPWLIVSVQTERIALFFFGKKTCESITVPSIDLSGKKVQYGLM